MGDFLETSYDKFIFKVKTGYLYSRDDFWASVEGNIAVIGVSDFLQKTRGDVAFLEAVDTGTEVKQDQEIGVIETIKATFGIMAPVSGKIIEVNPELEANPYLINQDPYGAGWIYRIELTDFESDKRNLLQDESYMKLMEEKIAVEVQKK